MSSSARNWYVPPHWHWVHIGVTAMYLNPNWHFDKRGFR
jgi:hypothetical protein